MSPPRPASFSKIMGSRFRGNDDSLLLIGLAEACLGVADRPAREVVGLGGPHAEARALVGVALDKRPLPQRRVALAERIPVARAAVAFGGHATAEKDAG